MEIISITSSFSSIPMLQIEIVIKWFWLLNVLFVTKFVSSSEIDAKESESQEYILCRQCGADVADAYFLDNVLSTYSKSQVKQNIFGKSSLVVQELENPLGIRFKIINSKKAHCVAIGTWHDAHTWYEGFAWRHCVCPKCRTQLGWMFQPISETSSNLVQATEKGFYGLILDGLLSEKTVDSLLVIPDSHRSSS